MASIYSLEPVENDPFDSQVQNRKYVLDTIAAGEARDYNTLYGGHKIKSLKDHPNIPVPIPNSDEHSTAAGRYQMLKSTWDAQAKKLGLKDFSPENQDIAALDLAQETYAKQTGRDLLDDAAKRTVQWGALVKQWPSLQRFINPEQAPAAVGLGAQQVAGDAPAIDPMIFQQLPAGQRNPALTPVDFDPFARPQK